MSSVIVNVETGAGGFTAYARQGGNEHQATATSPELATRLAAARILRQPLEQVQAERKQLGMWHATTNTREVA